MNVAHLNSDFSSTQATIGEIDEIVSEIRFLEVSLADCRQKPRKPVSGLEPVKSNVGEFATLGCDDLRKRYVATSRKLSSLRRQLESISTQSNADLQSQYKSGEQELKDLKIELSNRCIKPAFPSSTTNRR